MLHAIVARRGQIILGLCCLFVLFVPGTAATFASQPVYTIPASWFAGGFDTAGWPTFGYNAGHSGDNPAQDILPALHGRITWQRNTGGSVFSAPVLANDTLYIGSTGGNVLALDARTGAVRWQHATGQFLNDSTPVVVGRVLFVGANRTWILALDATNGRQLWAANLQEVIKAAPTYADGLVLVNSSNATTALDARTGQMRWAFRENGFGWPTTAAPTVNGQTVYVAQGTRTIVYALNLQTGRQLWAYNAADRLISTPVIIGNSVIIGTWRGKVEALDAAHGTRIWQYNVNQALPRGMPIDGIAGSPAATGNTLFIGTYNGDDIALNATTGTVRWVRMIDAPVLGTPAIEGSVLYVSGRQTLYALDAKTGKLLWHLTLGDIRNAVALGPGQLYVGTVQGNVYAIA